MTDLRTTESAGAEIEALGPWFHNLHLPDGRRTAPEHVLGDFPACKWAQIEAHVPENLQGLRVLDIGCNAGFYSFELARRGASVLAIDVDPHYLRQARWAADQFGLQDAVTFRRMQVYDLHRLEETFDIVWFMGVLYHLRYPLLALDMVAERLAPSGTGRDAFMMFQSLTMPGDENVAPPADLPMDQRDTMRRGGWPLMAFIERRLAGDPTNWWAPNDACIRAMLRTAGLRVDMRPGHEIYICRRDAQDDEKQRIARDEYHAVTKGVTDGAPVGHHDGS